MPSQRSPLTVVVIAVAVTEVDTVPPAHVVPLAMSKPEILLYWSAMQLVRNMVVPVQVIVTVPVVAPVIVATVVLNALVTSANEVRFVTVPLLEVITQA